MPQSPARHACNYGKRDLSNSKRDLSNSKRDLSNRKRDLSNSKRDQSNSNYATEPGETRVHPLKKHAKENPPKKYITSKKEKGQFAGLPLGKSVINGRSYKIK